MKTEETKSEKTFDGTPGSLSHVTTNARCNAHYVHVQDGNFTWPKDWNVPANPSIWQGPYQQNFPTFTTTTFTPERTIEEQRADLEKEAELRELDVEQAKLDWEQAMLNLRIFNLENK